MTNQQGAPEALRLADEYAAAHAKWALEDLYGTSKAFTSEKLAARHAARERLAALVEAQQPAPSAAAAVNPYPHAELRKTWRPGQRWQARSFRNGQWGPWTDAVASEPFWFPHQDYRRHPDDLAPQPSPTPQADSQPAPVAAFEVADAMADSQYLAGVSAGWNAANADDPNAALQKLHESRAGYLKPLFAARAPADSVTAPALSKGEFKQFLTDVHTAAGLVSHGKRCKALGERLGNAVMRLLAAATAPAGGVVARVLLDSAGKPMLRPQLLDEEFLADPEAFDSMYPHRAPHRIADLYATPPAQAADSVQDLQPVHDAVTIDLLNERVAYLENKLKAADSVLEDAARYRWLRTQDNEDFEFAVVKNPHFDVFESPEKLDAAIDAARKQGANHD